MNAIRIKMTIALAAAAGIMALLVYIGHQLSSLAVN